MVRQSIFIICCATLMLLSSVILSSIAPALAPKQVGFISVSAVLLLIMSAVPSNWWQQLSTHLLVGCCILLAIPFIFSIQTRGTARWIPLGSFNFQPSQIALPITCLFCATRLSKQHSYSLQTYGTLALWCAPLLGFIFFAPDLGTAVVLCACIASMVFAGPLKLRYAAIVSVCVLLFAIFAWFFLLKEYQKLRVTSFIDPNSDSAASYNAQQAQIAVGSGGIWGRGLGEGLQSHLRFLPERQTDFVFASFAEEFGLVGCLILLGLYAAIGSVLLQLMYTTHSTFARFFLVGTTSVWVLQSSIHILMNIGLFPVKGITLPLLSYGGSSLLGWTFALGICLRLLREEYSKPSLHMS